MNFCATEASQGTTALLLSWSRQAQNEMVRNSADEEDSSWNLLLSFKPRSRTLFLMHSTPMSRDIREADKMLLVSFYKQYKDR